MAIRTPDIRQPNRPSYDGRVKGLAERGVREGAGMGAGLRKKVSRRRRFDPYDVMSAVARLVELLANDFEHGIPDDVPNRGYYLNILV